MDYEALLRNAAEEYLEPCGSCICYHPVGFSGDCRDDSNRFASPEDLVSIWLAAPKLLWTLKQICREYRNDTDDGEALGRCNEIAEVAINEVEERT